MAMSKERSAAQRPEMRPASVGVDRDDGHSRQDQARAGPRAFAAAEGVCAAASFHSQKAPRRPIDDGR